MNEGDALETGCFHLSIVLFCNLFINSYLSESAGPPYDRFPLRVTI